MSEGKRKISRKEKLCVLIAANSPENVILNNPLVETIHRQFNAHKSAKQFMLAVFLAKLILNVFPPFFRSIHSNQCHLISASNSFVHQFFFLLGVTNRPFSLASIECVHISARRRNSLEIFRVTHKCTKNYVFVFHSQSALTMVLKTTGTKLEKITIAHTPIANRPTSDEQQLGTRQTYAKTRMDLVPISATIRWAAKFNGRIREHTRQEVKMTTINGDGWLDVEYFSKEKKKKQN